MFLGEFQYKVDMKGRIPLPPKFRQALNKGIVLMRGPEEKCVFGYDQDGWEKVADSLSSQTVGARDLRQLNRVLFGEASEEEMDGQGRVMLSQKLRRYAEIGNSAIVVGANDHFEIWNVELWEIERLKAEEKMGQYIENIEEKR